MKLYSQGLWDNLSSIEDNSSIEIKKSLLNYENIIKKLYECGTEAPTLTSKRVNTIDLKVSALFLKRILSDLRTIWIMIIKGYTNQAGSIAAETFESALLVSVISGDIKKAEKVLNQKNKKIPWSTQQMCKMQAEKYFYEEKQENVSKEEYFTTWTQIYASYIWLCQIKHPTIQSVLHDSGTTKIKDNEYVIMALPDTRKEDLPNKKLILSITVSRIIAALNAFIRASDLDEQCERFKTWGKNFEVIENECFSEIKTIKGNRIPFDVSHINFGKYYK